jgi:hypothetical protein
MRALSTALALLPRGLVGAFVGLSLAACGPNGVGEACGYPGESRDCAEGAICTPDIMAETPGGFDPTWASYTCRVDCTTGTRCDEGFECRPVSGREMISTCQPLMVEE